MLGRAYIDESADEHTGTIFSATALIGADLQWKQFRRAWNKALVRSRIRYFKNSQCMSVTGEFAYLRDEFARLEEARQAALKIRSRFDKIIEDHGVTAVTVGMEMHEFKALNARQDVRQNPNWASNYMVSTYQCVIGLVGDTFLGIGKTATPEQRKYPPIVSFVCDDNDSLKKQITEAYDTFKIKFPDLAQFMNGLSHLDDKKEPLLQAADLLAAIGRDLCVEGLAEPERTLSPRVPSVFVKVCAVGRKALEEALNGTRPWVTRNEIKIRRLNRV